MVLEERSQPLVLAIDDSKLIHKLLGARLIVEDVELISALDGAQGLRVARDRLPDLILLDLNMPGLDGFETLHRLKDSAATVNIPVILLSGSEDTEDKVRGLDLGAIDYICKSFETTEQVAELRARIRAGLRLAHLMSLLARRAQLDGLTGIWNRQHFDETLEAELGLKQRRGTQLSLCLCDLDHFKSLNDTFGHAAGDAVLQRFATMLRRKLRASDTPCRYGGEEFAIVLRDTHASEAMLVLERIRSALMDIVWGRHPERRVTASFGVFDGGGQQNFDPANWVERADEALYDAKSSGRNTVRVAGSGSATTSLAA